VRILVACEHSGTVREAFNAMAGVYAMSCDLLPCSDGRDDFHHQGDVREILGNGWDLMVCHPQCTYINSAGLHWISRGRIEADGRPRAIHRDEALAFVELLWKSGIPKIALENPMGCINTRLPFMPKPQYVQPYQFGDDASKKTGLWLRGLPPLVIDPSKRKAGRLVEWNGKTVERWSNQTDSGQNNLGPSDDRGHLRAITYPGIARAMAEQWTKTDVNLL